MQLCYVLETSKFSLDNELSLQLLCCFNTSALNKVCHSFDQMLDENSLTTEKQSLKVFHILERPNSVSTEQSLQQL